MAATGRLDGAFHAALCLGLCVLSLLSRSRAQVLPRSNLAGGVTVGIETFLGTGVSVIPYISIGDHSVVGAGSVVIRNVPDRTTTFGVPAHHQQTVSNNDEP